ncbi:MAG: hypothetical protein H6R26_31 [Proteobacteria bacterium]|nr:hypothetical protein [Pseudomonadota bacterium]
MTTSLRRHDRRVLAIQLIQRGLRTTPVRELTCLPDAEIRTLYRTLHGKSPPSGDVPCAASLFQTRRAQIQVSLFASIYRRIGGPAVLKNVNANALIQGYDLFRELTAPKLQESKGQIDFTGGWVIARDLREGKALLILCPDCRVHYLVAENSDFAADLPVLCLAQGEEKTEESARQKSDRDSDLTGTTAGSINARSVHSPKA